MTDFGRDIKCSTDITPTLQDDDGLSLMQGVAVRQLYTPNQSLLSDPSHQSIDLRQFLSTDSMVQSNGQLNTNGVSAAAKAALLADPRVFSAAVRIEWFPDANYMTVGITGVCAEGPFALTLGVSQVTIKILQQ